MDVVAILAAAAAMISAIAAPVITEFIRSRSAERIRRAEIFENMVQKSVDEFVASYTNFLSAPNPRQSRTELMRASYALAARIGDPLLRGQLIGVAEACSQFDTLQNSPEEKISFINSDAKLAANSLFTYLSETRPYK